MAQLIRASVEARSALLDLHAGGISHPRKELIDALGYRAICTGLRQTIWAPRFEPTNPNDRKTFSGLFAAWGAQIESAIAALADERTDRGA